MKKLINFFKTLKDQRGYFFWLVKYSKPYIPQISLTMFLKLIMTLSSTGMAIVSKDIIDKATNGDDILLAIVMYIGLILLMLLFNVISEMISLVLDEKFSFGIRKQLYEQIINSHWMDVKRYDYFTESYM